MNAYTKYLVKKFKDISKSDIRLIVIPCYIDKNDNTYWDLPSDNCENCKKCIMFGYDNISAGNTRLISSSNKSIWGYSIKFQHEWKSNSRAMIDADSDVGNEIIENVFMQCMALSEHQDIYIDKMLLFAKGSVYEHMMLAELTT